MKPIIVIAGSVTFHAKLVQRTSHGVSRVQWPQEVSPDGALCAVEQTLVPSENIRPAAHPRRRRFFIDPLEQMRRDAQR